LHAGLNIEPFLPVLVIKNHSALLLFSLRLHH
jgi:hypothetical protein